VSDGNPFSESQFKTLKYRPAIPDRFDSNQNAREFSINFFTWYNGEHRHPGIGLMTPEVVDYGKAAELWERRQHVYLAAAEIHPERFVRKPPSPPALPTAVWINKPKEETG
jgi:putative transposase